MVDTLLRLSKRCICVGLALVVPGGVAQAQYARDLQGDSTLAQALIEPQPQIEELPEVTVTATRSRPEQVFRVPTAVTVLSQERASERTQTTIVDLLKGEVGVWVQSSGTGQGTPYVRGVTGREVLLMQDGFRVSPAFMRSGPNQYLALLDPYFFTRLEVARGPASTLYGSDALGGAVNVITPVPEFNTEQVQVKGRVLAGFAAVTTEKTGRLEVQAGRSGQAFSLGLTYRDFDDFRLGGNADARLSFPNLDPRTITGTGYEFQGGDLRAVVDIDPTQRIVLTGQYTNLPRIAAIDSLIQGYGSSVSDALNLFQSQGRLFAALNYEVTPEQSWLDQARLTVGFQRIQDDRLRRPYSVRPSFPNYGSGIAENFQDSERNSSNLFGSLLTLTSQLGSRNTLTYGGEIYTDTIFSDRLRTTDAGATTNRPDRYISGSSFDQYGLFVQDTIRWSEQFTSVLGVRYSSVAANVPADSVRGSTAFVNATSDLTYNAGLSYLLTPEINFVTNVGRGFRAPNLSDLSQSGAEGNQFNSPNPNLRAEQVFSVDTGFKVRSSQWSGEVIGFYSQYSDRILNVNTGQQIDGLDERQLQNVGSQVIGGVEFGGQYRPLPNLALFGTATWTQGDTTQADGKVVPADRIPPFNGIAGLRWEPGSAYVEPFLRYAGAQNRLAPNNLTDNRINPNGSAGFFVFNLRAGYRLQDNLWVRLVGDNLTSVTYREHGSSLDGLGANVYVNLDYRY